MFGIEFPESPINISKHEVLILEGSLGLAAVFLAYAYFIMGWGSTRIAEWESNGCKGGNPVLTLWISGTGVFLPTVAGGTIYPVLYIYSIISKHQLDWTHILAIPGQLIGCIWLWLNLFNWLKFFLWNHKEFQNADELLLRRLPDYALSFQMTLPTFLLAGVMFIYQIIMGQIVPSLCGIFFIFTAAYGLGAYATLRGDLLPRAMAKPSK